MSSYTREWGEGRGEEDRERGASREGKGERKVEEGEKCIKFIHW